MIDEWVFLGLVTVEVGCWVGIWLISVMISQGYKTLGGWAKGIKGETDG